MIRRIRIYRKYSHQNGTGFFDIIKKAGKFLGSKKARKILKYGRKGLHIAEKAQRGIAGFTGQSGAGMRGGAGMRKRRGNHPITPTQVRQLLHLLNNNNRSRSRRRGGGKRGRMVRRRGHGRNQKGGFIGWLIKQFM